METASMYQTTTQFIAAAKTLKEALLLSLVVGKPLRIETGAAGSVPCIPCTPYRTIINNHLSLQAVDPREPHRAPDRSLKRQFCGDTVRIFCNYDCTTSLMLQVVNEHPWIFMDIRCDSAPSVAEHVFEKLCYSITLRMPPDAVKELLDFVSEDPVFDAENLTNLRVRYKSVLRNVSETLGAQTQKAVRATRSDREDRAEARAAGLKSDFGYGVGPRGTEDLLKIGAASCVINGGSEVSSEDLVNLVPAVLAHRVLWGWEGQQLYPGYVGDLTKIAKWAFSV